MGNYEDLDAKMNDSPDRRKAGNESERSIQPVKMQTH